jgi:hypothetical protein
MKLVNSDIGCPDAGRSHNQFEEKKSPTMAPYNKINLIDNETLLKFMKPGGCENTQLERKASDLSVSRFLVS